MTEHLSTEREARDVVEEAREKLAKPNYGMGKRNRELMTSLCDEVERLREHVKDLNHDFEAAIKECNEHHG